MEISLQKIELKRQESSANLVTESMLPFADYLGHKKGYDDKEISNEVELISGTSLQVPILKESP